VGNGKVKMGGGKCNHAAAMVKRFREATFRGVTLGSRGGGDRMAGLNDPLERKRDRKKGGPGGGGAGRMSEQIIKHSKISE